MCRVATADCSVNSLSVDVWSMTSWHSAGRAGQPLRGEPQPAQPLVVRLAARTQGTLPAPAMTANVPA
jgi:hypothetical protein